MVPVDLVTVHRIVAKDNSVHHAVAVLADDGPPTAVLLVDVEGREEEAVGQLQRVSHLKGKKKKKNNPVGGCQLFEPVENVLLSLQP